MEKQIKVLMSDKKYIYGILRGSLQNPLVVFVHGLTGDMNEHQFFNGARYLEKEGFSSFRFNLYGWEKDARKLGECTLTTHANDLDRVIQYFRKRKVKRIFVVGHSYGGKTILMSEHKDFDGVVLWDPSHNSSPLFRKVHFVKKLGGYINLEGSYGIFVGQQMVKEEQLFPWKAKIREIRVPIKIICAEKNILVQGSKAYYIFANKPKALVVIQGATHCFDEEGTEEKLFQQTAGWFKKFNKGLTLAFPIK